MADIQSAAAEIRRGKKKKKNKPQHENIHRADHKLDVENDSRPPWRDVETAALTTSIITVFAFHYTTAATYLLIYQLPY